MIFNITVLYRGYNNKAPEYVAVTVDGLFQLVCTLNRSKDVVAFQVTEGGTNISYSAFGWGPFEKWRRELYKEDSA